jgi:hypothetical protein
MTGCKKYRKSLFRVSSLAAKTVFYLCLLPSSKEKFFSRLLPGSKHESDLILYLLPGSKCESDLILICYPVENENTI